MNKTELFIYYEGKWREVILGENISFPITYNIADVRDISKRNGSFTKTIKVPHTPENSQLFDFIFDVGNDSIYDVNKKVRCYVLNDTIQVFEGFLQLRGINTNDNNHFTYDCVIFGENDTFIKSIGDKFVDEIDISDIDHIYDYNNIVDSWTDDWTRGYYYPLIGYNLNIDQVNFNTGSVSVSDFYPSIYVKFLFDRMFSDVGFSYTSNFLESDTFKNLIIPYSGANVRDDLWNFENRIRISLNATQSLFVTAWGGDPGSIQNNSNLPYYLGDGYSINEEWFSFNMNERIEFNNETPPNGDPSGRWDIINYEYTEGSGLPKSMRFIIDMDLTYNDYFTYERGPITYPSFVDESEFFTYIRVKRSRNPITGAVAPNGYTMELDGPLAPANFIETGLTPLVDPFDDSRRYTYLLTGWDDFGNNYLGANRLLPESSIVDFSNDPTLGYRRYVNRITSLFLDGSTPERRGLYQGERVWIEVGSVCPAFLESIIRNNANGDEPLHPTYNAGLFPFNLNADPFLNQEEIKIFNEFELNLQEGQGIEMNYLLPPKLKQKDFLSSIVKMFNLFIEPDRNDPNNLIIEPRDDYYEFGVVRDWSDKLDISKPINQKIIAELQSKSLVFTYKIGKDKISESYDNRFKAIYGEYEYILDNEYVSGEKKIEPVFSSTVLGNIVPNSEIITSLIVSKNDNEEEGIAKHDGSYRILFRGESNIDLKSETWKLNGVTQSSYPYAGHFNHPTLADEDLNFGVPRSLFYFGNTITNNNLYNVYYRRMIEELTNKDSRIVTANFYLTPDDLNKLRFYDKIFVDSMASGTGVYYRINKIEYDPVRAGSYKVELLKVNDIKFEKSKKETVVRPPVIDWNPVKPVIGIITIGKGNAVLSANGITIGNFNTTDPSNVNNFIFGDRNKIGAISNNSGIVGGVANYIQTSPNSIVMNGFGSNIINSNNSTLVGSKNSSIISGSNSVMIGGENAVMRNGGVFIGDRFTKISNFISAGRDEVLNVFPDNKVENFVSAGRDTIREMGTHTIENLISSGYDFII